ncbi:MAG: class II aldolase/adducin family protein [Bryobacteraceae bacterium]
MSDIPAYIRDLVIANRILANEGVLDAYGHVSLRHPDDPARFLLSCSRSPELVQPEDIVEHYLHGQPVNPDGRKLYLERFIHGAVFEARPDVTAVVHSHAEDVLPFSLVPVPLKPVIHNASRMGSDLPMWDIRDTFGDTNMLVAKIEQGRDMAKALGSASVVLMRGHGFTAASATLSEAVGIGVYLPKNARVLMNAMRLGNAGIDGVKTLTQGELDCINVGSQRHDFGRAWEYWSRRAGF